MNESSSTTFFIILVLLLIWVIIETKPWKTGPSFMCRSKMLNTPSYHIIIPVTFGGIRKYWLLDTGSTISLINKSFADTLGISKNAKRIISLKSSTTEDVPVVDLPEGRVIGTKGSKCMKIIKNEAVVQDLNGLFSGLNFTGIQASDFGGILGYPFLKKYVIEYDFPNRLVNFHDDHLYQAPSNAKSVPLKIYDKYLYIPIQVEGKEGSMSDWSIDTGSETTLLTYKYSQALKITGTGKKSKIVTAGGHVDIYTQCCLTLNIGDKIKIKKVTVQFPDKKSFDALEDSAGNFGLDLMKEFNVIIDYKRLKIHFI